MSEDKIIVSVLPFANPKNNAERRINDEAMKYYLDPEERRMGGGFQLFAPNPDHAGHQYFCSASWTREGWRTYTLCMTAEQLLKFSTLVFEAEDNALLFLSNMERETRKN